MFDPFDDAGFLNTNTAPHQHPQMANYGLMDQVPRPTVLIICHVKKADFEIYDEL